MGHFDEGAYFRPTVGQIFMCSAARETILGNGNFTSVNLIAMLKEPKSDMVKASCGD